MRIRPVGPIGLLLAVAAACGDPNPLPPANLPNFVDTVTIWSLSATPVWRPSAYSTAEARPVRLDVSSLVDFAYDFPVGGQPLFRPGRLVGQPGGGLDPGLQRASQPFDSVKIAVINGYTTVDTVHIAAGNVFYVRGRVAPTCFFGLPTYGKVEVLDFDHAERTVRFRVLVNGNCGYKGLEPGLPTR